MKPKREKKLLSNEQRSEASEWLKAMAHPQRIFILQLLINGKYTVGELAKECGIASATMSNHLRLMERCGLLSGKRDAQRIYYEVNDPQVMGIVACLEIRFSD